MINCRIFDLDLKDMKCCLYYTFLFLLTAGIHKFQYTHSFNQRIETVWSKKIAIKNIADENVPKKLSLYP